MTVLTKRCSECKTEKPLADFHKKKSSKDGFNYRCKACIKVYMHARYEAKKPELLAQNAVWIAAHPEEQKEYTKTYRTGRGRYVTARNAAKQRKLAFELSREEYEALVSHPCHYCDGPLNSWGLGLDRKNNRLGYTLDNVLPCCKDCNLVRADRYTVQEMEFIGISLKEVRLMRQRNGLAPKGNSPFASLPASLQQ